MDIHSSDCYVCKKMILLDAYDDDTVRLIVPGIKERVTICSDCDLVIAALDDSISESWWEHVGRIRETKERLWKKINGNEEVKCVVCDGMSAFKLNVGRFVSSMNISKDFEVIFLCNQCAKIARLLKSYPDWQNDIEDARRIVSMERIVGLKGAL